MPTMRPVGSSGPRRRAHGGPMWPDNRTARCPQRAAVSVRETFLGRVVWEGVVSVFDLAGHPRVTRAYAWSHALDGSERRRFVAVLHGGRSIPTWRRSGRLSCRTPREGSHAPQEQEVLGTRKHGL